jgi:hypothetical protein
MILREGGKDGGKSLCPLAILLAPTFCLFGLGIDALANIFPPFAGDLPGLGEGHSRIAADPTRRRTAWEACNEHEGTLVILGAVIGDADAKPGNLCVIDM